MGCTLSKKKKKRKKKNVIGVVNRDSFSVSTPATSQSGSEIADWDIDELSYDSGVVDEYNSVPVVLTPGTSASTTNTRTSPFKPTPVLHHHRHRNRHHRKRRKRSMSLDMLRFDGGGGDEYFHQHYKPRHFDGRQSSDILKDPILRRDAAAYLHTKAGAFQLLEWILNTNGQATHLEQAPKFLGQWRTASATVSGGGGGATGMFSPEWRYQHILPCAKALYAFKEFENPGRQLHKPLDILDESDMDGRFVMELVMRQIEYEISLRRRTYDLAKREFTTEFDKRLREFVNVSTEGLREKLKQRTPAQEESRDAPSLSPLPNSHSPRVSTRVLSNAISGNASSSPDADTHVKTNAYVRLISMLTIPSSSSSKGNHKDDRLYHTLGGNKLYLNHGLVGGTGTGTTTTTTTTTISTTRTVSTPQSPSPINFKDTPPSPLLLPTEVPLSINVHPHLRPRPRSHSYTAATVRGAHRHGRPYPYSSHSTPVSPR